MQENRAFGANFINNKEINEFGKGGLFVRSRLKKGFGLVFPLTLLICCMVILWIAQTFHLDPSRLRLVTADEYNQGWSIVSGRGTLEVPSVSRDLTVDSSSLVLHNTLPDFNCNQHALCFRSNNEKVRVSVDGQNIYSYGYNDEAPFGSYFGIVWNLVPLEEDMAGKSVTIELTALSTDKTQADYIFYLDNRNTIIGTLLANNWPLLCNLLICGTVGLLLLCSGLLYLQAGTAVAKARIYLGAFVLLTQLYVFSDGGFMQYFVNNKAVAHFTVHASLMLLPAPFAMYLSELFPRWQQDYRRLSALFCSYFLLRVLLYILNVVEISSLLTITHGLILLALTYAAVMCLADTKSLMSRIMLGGIMLFFVFVFGAILLFYTVPHLDAPMPIYTFIFSLGIDVLMIFFYSALLKSSLNTATHIQIYERQAYTDSLTQVNNRAAFNLLLDQLPPETHPRLTLIMVDLNNLKLVNDTLGHPAGDKLICSLVDCLKQAFENIGLVYRYGGDEFVVVLEDSSSAEVLSARSRLDQLLAEHRQHGGQEISVAVGIASRQDSQCEQLHVNDLLHMADVAMYQVKAEQKSAPVAVQVVRHQRLEQTDPTTGILTFSAFKTNVYNALAAGDVRFPSIVTFDVNFFDGYNNLFGWEAGNRLLLKLTSLALRLCGEKGFCAHGDADTFWVFADMPDLQTLTDSITAESRLFQQQLDDCLLFPSFGIYCISERMLPVSDMCSRATSAKKRIKGHLDVLYTVYSTEEHQRRIDNMKLISYMQKGLDSEEFIPFYQPKFRCSDGMLVGAEALARWGGSPGESTSAGEFTALFEKSGLILKLDWYMLEKTCQLLRSQLDGGMACVPVSINFSRLHLYEDGCAQRLESIVDNHCIPHSLVEIELTETALVQDSQRILHLISELQSAGFAVSLDDFGSGVSSLGSLNSVRVDTIKIDRSLIETTPAGDDNDIFEFVVGLCGHLGIHTLSEGVETQQQLDRVRRSGCAMVQGNFFSPPLCQADFTALLQKHSAAKP